MSEGFHQQPHREKPTAPPSLEGALEYITEEAIWLPGMDKPATGPRHALIMQELSDEQLRLIETLDRKTAGRAYGYVTSKGRYIYGTIAVRIAQGDRVVPADEDIQTADTSDFKPTIH